MSAPALSTSGLSRRFGALPAVAGLDLTVPRGAVYGFLGPNGAGKTTTIRMLLGLIRPDAGEVRLFGVPLQARTRRDLLRRIGALVEMPSIYSHLTGRENLEAARLLLGTPRSRIGRVLELVRLIALSMSETLARRPVFAPWSWLAGAAFSTWTLVLFPLLLSLEAALLAAIEHRSNGFKHLFALPVRRGAVYGAKQIAVVLLTVASLLLLLLGLVAGGLALRSLRPGLGFEAPVPWGDFLLCGGRILAASGLILAVHTWMSLRWKSFAPVLALGILATVATIALNTGDVEVWPWFPWSLPFRAARGFGQAAVDPALLAVGALGGLVAAVLAGCEMTRRDVL